MCYNMHTKLVQSSANYFNRKIDSAVDVVVVEGCRYNGSRIVAAGVKNFRTTGFSQSDRK